MTDCKQINTLTVSEALKHGEKSIKHVSSSARLDAELLLLHAMEKKDRTWLIANSKNNVHCKHIAVFDEYIERRKNHEPIPYITKHKEFYGLDFYVDKRVLIPRPETEMLTDEVLSEVNTHNLQASKSTILYADIGTGSACIPISVLKNIRTASKNFTILSYGTDISPDALDVADINIKLHNLTNQIILYQGNLLEPIFTIVGTAKLSRIVITANLPYISRAEYMEPYKKDILHEPKKALIGGDSGIDLFAELFVHVNTLKSHLSNPIPITLMLEHGNNQANVIKSLATKMLSPYTIITKKDISDNDRITIIRA